MLDVLRDVRLPHVLEVVVVVDRAAALDLAYVAAGRLDGYWECGLKPWDLAGGILLVREAGGFVEALDEGAGVLETGTVLAANPHIHETLGRILRGA